MIDSVRTKLTLWYVGLLALVLIAFSLGVYALMARKLQSRLDAGLRIAVEGVVRLILHEKEEGETDQYAAGSALRKSYFPRQAVAFFDHNGGLLKEKTLGEIHATLPAGIAALDRDGLQYYTLPEAKTGSVSGLRVAVERIKTGPQSAIFLVICQPVEDVSGDLELLSGILIVAVPLALLGVAAVGWFLARKSLTPVVEMSERARQISAENLDQRLPVINPRDELGRLATTFNQLLARLNEAFAKQQEAFAQQRQFMADASHELRTPLYVMRTAGEVTMDQEQCEASEYREALAMINQQTRHLTRIVEDMFTLARADAGQRKPEARDLYLDELVVETARAARVLAERKGVKIETSPLDETPYHGDEGLLRQMLLNLLDNAVKHTPAGGGIRVSLAQHDSRHEITVADTGVGIPPEAQPHIFERFYRADKARTRGKGEVNGGAGLGLSIARWIAEAHNGQMELRHSDERGSTFVITLPVTRQSAGRPARLEEQVSAESKLAAALREL
jgi:heavy metal sensor kinase